jgi:hypothetical protein
MVGGQLVRMINGKSIVSSVRDAVAVGVGPIGQLRHNGIITALVCLIGTDGREVG